MSQLSGYASRAPLVVDAVKKHTATIIMAHGLGDSGLGWVSLAQNWRHRGKFEDVKFVFPNAPSIPISINFGMEMPGWYDITTLSDLDAAHDKPGIMKSRTYFTNLIEEEVKNGIVSERIILGGFSQGGAISIFTGVTTKHKLGGVFGLSAYMLLHNELKELVKEADHVNKDTPFFMGHGDKDEVVRYEWGRRTADFVEKELGHNLTFKTYRGLPHSADVQEIDDLEAFIKGCLKEDNSSTSAL